MTTELEKAVMAVDLEKVAMELTRHGEDKKTTADLGRESLRVYVKEYVYVCVYVNVYVKMYVCAYV